MVEYIEKDKAIEAVENIVCSMSVCMNTEECKGMKIKLITHSPRQAFSAYARGHLLSSAWSLDRD